MIAGLPKALSDEFERSVATVERRKILLRERFQAKADDDQDRLKKQKEEKEARERFEAVLASHQQIADFGARLDRYDTATVESLLDNQRALDRVHERLEKLRANAHVLPDGRRVFPTLAGDAVYDESGAQVDRDVLDPQAIRPGTSTWEEFVAASDERKQLDSERDGLFTFQAKLDATRERIANGGLTTKEISDLDADLKASVPTAVAGRLRADRADAAPVSNSPAQPDAPMLEPMDKPPSRPSAGYRP